MFFKVLSFFFIASLLEVRISFCQSFLHQLSRDYSLTHNSCMRKLLCLISSSDSRSQYENIMSGLNFFYSGMPDKEPFITDKQLMQDAWSSGLKSANNNSNSEICETLMSTKSCDVPNNQLMKSFNNVYDKNVSHLRPKRFENLNNIYKIILGLVVLSIRVEV